MRLRKKSPTTLRQRMGPTPVEQSRLNGQSSYHSQRSEQSNNTGRKFRQAVLNPAAKKFSGFWFQRFGLGILLIVSAVCLVNILRLSSNVSVQQVGPVNRSSLFNRQDVYQQTAKSFLDSSFASNNKLSINTVKLSNQMLAAFPELETVTVAIPLVAQRPIVYVSYTQPALIIHNQSGSFVLDTEGKVLVATNSEAINLGLPSVTDQSSLVLALNRQVLSSGDVTFIRDVVAGLKAKQIVIRDMSLPSASSELDVSVLGKPYFIKFNLHAKSAREQVGTYLAVQGHLQDTGVTPAKYIDVRVDGRAYYN